MSAASKRREKQKWAVEKPKFDNARKLRCIYFIDPAEKELKAIVQNARRKLEFPMPAAMPRRNRCDQYRESRSVLDDRTTKYTCIVEADESTRKRMEGTLHKGHEDHTLNHFNHVHKFIPMPQAVKIPDAKAAVDR